MMYAEEFKKAFKTELEVFGFENYNGEFMFDIVLFEHKFGGIEKHSLKRQNLLYKIAEKY